MGSVALNILWTSTLFTEHLRLQVSLIHIDSKISTQIHILKKKNGCPFNTLFTTQTGPMSVKLCILSPIIGHMLPVCKASLISKTTYGHFETVVFI